MTDDINQKLDAIRSELAAIAVKVSGLPLMAATLLALRDDGRQLRREVRMVQAAVNDIARENVTPGEIAALHAELDRLAESRIDIESRLSLLETGR